MIGTDAPERANWEVIWLNPKTKKLKRVDFGHDLASATETYIKVKSAGRKIATLRCKNFGFPPPEKLQPYVHTFKKPKRIPGHSKPVRSVRVTPLRKLNAEGVYWCPYCMQLRKFKEFAGFRAEGKYQVNENNFGCPVCRISCKDHHVRKWNPLAISIQYHMEEKRVRAPTKSLAEKKAAYKKRKKKRKPYKKEK